MNHCDYCAQFVNLPAKILDVGSGKGNFLCAMAKKGFKVYGVEANAEYIKTSYSLARMEKVRVEIKQSKAEKLLFPNNYFDFVNCAEVTEHLDDPLRVYREIYHVLKQGGKCYISFHNRFGVYDYHYHLYFINLMPRSCAEIILKFFKKQKTDSVIGRQRLATMHYYTYGKIKKILENIGFSVKDIREEKIKKTYKHIAFPFLMIYYFLRPFYFNTFHLLLNKSLYD